LSSFLRMLGTWIVTGWRPSRPRRVPGMRSLIGFGANLTGFTFVNYFARTSDNMLIGRWWGEAPLGFYERGYKLMMAPLMQINVPVTNVIVPALSRVRDEPAKYREAYFRVSGLFQLLSCPLMAFVVVTAPWVVQFVFGPGWEPSGPILRWLAVAGFVQPLGSSIGWLFISQNRAREMMYLGCFASVSMISAFICGLPWGPLGVARAYAVVCVILTPIGFWYVGRRGPIHGLDFARLLMNAVMFSAPGAIAAGIVAWSYPQLSGFVGLVAAGAAAAVATTAVVLGTKHGREIVFETSKLFMHAFDVRLKRSADASASGK